MPSSTTARWARSADPVLALLAVIAGRSVLAWASERAAHRASASAKSELRRAAAEQVAALGPAGLERSETGRLATLLTTGIDALDGYFARYLPQLFLAVIVPVAVIAVVAGADWVSAVLIAVSLPLIPLFMALVGATTRERTVARMRSLQRLAGPFSRRRLRASDAEGLRAGQSAGPGDRRRHRPLPGDHSRHVAAHLPLLARSGTAGDGVRGAGGRGRRAAAPRRGHVLPRRALRPRPGPRGLSAAAGAGRQLPRQRRRHAGGPGRLLAPGAAGGGPERAAPSRRPTRPSASAALDITYPGRRVPALDGADARRSLPGRPWP